jgi:hypothetical protein
MQVYLKIVRVLIKAERRLFPNTCLKEVQVRNNRITENKENICKGNKK